VFSTADRREAVDVVWSTAVRGDRDEARLLLTALVAEWGAVSPARVRLGHLCPRCGSSSHGRPVVVRPNTPTLYVSLARSPGLAVAAVTSAAPVGVDVERADSTAFAGFGTMALHPTERDGSPNDRAALWTRKEAVLKAVGLGVGWGPERVPVGPVQATHGRVEGLADGSAPVSWRALSLEPGYAGAVAVVGDQQPELRVRRAAAGDEAR
jgi:4'-phosphopantetheinyl transferase